MDNKYIYPKYFTSYFPQIFVVYTDTPIQLNPLQSVLTRLRVYTQSIHSSI